MNIMVSQQVEIEGDNFPHLWRKEYESEIIPTIGMYVEDPIWKDPGEYKVLSVTVNYYDNSCYIAVEKYNMQIPNERKDFFAEMANGHGWKCSWNTFE